MKLHSQVPVPQLFFSLWKLFNELYCVLPLGLQVTQTSLSPRTTPMVQMNFWPKAFHDNSHIVTDKGKTTHRKKLQLGTLKQGVGGALV